MVNLARCSSIALLSVLITACACDPPFLESTTAPAEVRAAVFNWLSCVECDGNELERVVDLGDSAVDALADVLVNGLSQATRERLMPTQRDANNPRSQAMMVTTPSGAPELADYHRAQAARALAAIDTDASRAVLGRARTSALPPTVERAVNDALR